VLLRTQVITISCNFYCDSSHTFLKRQTKTILARPEQVINFNVDPLAEVRD